MKKINVTITLRGTIMVNEDTARLLKKSDRPLDFEEVDLPWDQVVNLDGDVEAA